MKKLVLVAFVASVSAFVAAPAFAHENQSGVSCRNYNGGEALDIDYYPSGVRNLASSPRAVICPVDFVPTADGSVTVYVDGRNNTADATTSCTLYSFDYNTTGASLGSVYDSKGGLGTWEMNLSLPAGQAPVWSYLAVLCTLPAGGNGLITGVTSMP